MMTKLPMQYLLPMMSGEGRLHHPRNADYSSVMPTSLSTFFHSRAGTLAGIAS